MSDIINGLIESGIKIERILEPKPLREDLIEEELEIFTKIPSTLIIKSLKK